MVNCYPAPQEFLSLQMLENLGEQSTLGLYQSIIQMNIDRTPNSEWKRAFSGDQRAFGVERSMITIKATEDLKNASLPVNDIDLIND